MFYDISPKISETCPVWLERQGYKASLVTDMHRGSPCNAYAFSTPAQIGASAVSSSHFSFKGKAIDECDLDNYIGPCQVIHVEVKPKGLIREPMLPVDIRCERVLIATGTFDYSKPFQKDFAALDASFIDELGKRGVMLVGIDTPSIDLFNDSALVAHHKTLNYDMAILTGLDLKEVPNGIYELIALPLKLVGLDASPVRAILRPQ